MRMTPEQWRKISRIVETYGDAQLDIAIEECSELIKAICKYKRKQDHVEDIVDEIADVKIMLAQLEIIFDCSGAVEDRVEYKINRQMERIEKELS